MPYNLTITNSRSKAEVRTDSAENYTVALTKAIDLIQEFHTLKALEAKSTAHNCYIEHSAHRRWCYCRVIDLMPTLDAGNQLTTSLYPLGTGQPFDLYRLTIERVAAN